MLSHETLRLASWTGFYVGRAGIFFTPLAGAVALSQFVTEGEPFGGFYDSAEDVALGSAAVTVLAIVGGYLIKVYAKRNTLT